MRGEKTRNDLKIGGPEESKGVYEKQEREGPVLGPFMIKETTFVGVSSRVGTEGSTVEVLSRRN